MAANNTIVLKGDLHRWHDEKLANAALLPGHLVEYMSTDKVRKNTIVAGTIPVYVAKEDGMRGGTKDGELQSGSTYYAADEQVMIHQARPGDVLNLRLPASASAVVKGDGLEPATGGVVQKLASGVRVFIAEEAVDNSAGSGEVFISARVL